MAKFAQNENKPYSPIDTKLLGALAESPIIEPVTPPAEAPPEPVAPPAVKKDEPKPPAKPAAKTTAKPKPAAMPTPVAETRKEQEKLSCPVKCLLTPSEDDALREMMLRLKKRTGISFNASYFIRAFFTLMIDQQEHIADEIVAAGLRRPINDRRAIAEFEQELAVILDAAMSKAESR